jgi:hypothetical protein
MKEFIINEQTLAQLRMIIGEIPTKFGIPLGNVLEQGLRLYEPTEDKVAAE